MSMPVTHIRGLLLAGLPLILFVCSIGLAIYGAMQNRPLSTGSGVILHQALSNIPSKNGEIDLDKFDLTTRYRGKDPFFRTEKESPSEPVLSSVSLEELHLTTIARGKRGRYCTVNGQIFYEGQTGKGFSIKKIEQDRVLFVTTIESFNLVPGQKVALESGRLVPFELIETTHTLSPETVQ
ncbi:MAG: hypothetical protein GY702_14985 [Desulfobulbaceae bacterium]|nr:hypothetical protein [Desulfobulbaceae bacterium]